MFISTQDTPDFPDLTTPQNKMLGRVMQGATPDNAAIAEGVENWRANAAFASLVNQAHAQCVCKTEQKAHDMVVQGKTIPTGLNFYLQAFCGWRTKYAEDGFAQTINLTIQPVDGYTREGEPPHPERPPVRKYRAGKQLP